MHKYNLFCHKSIRAKGGQFYEQQIMIDVIS